MITRPGHAVRRCVEIYSEDGLLSLLDAIRTHLSITLFESTLFVHLFWLVQGRRIVKEDDIYLLVDFLGREQFAFPQFQFHRNARRQRKRLLETKWFSDEYFPCVEPDDTVLEVGGFTGITTAIAAERGKEVYVLEPSPRNRKCLERNVTADNVTVLPYAAGEENTTTTFNIGEMASKDSLSDPKHGSSGHSVDVDVRTIESVCEEMGIDRVDFLKLDAEGLEPEVLRGIGDVEVRKAVISGSNERDGEYTAPDVSSLLESRGYEVFRSQKFKPYFVHAIRN
jgi:FkbM family methyltransferase